MRWKSSFCPGLPRITSGPLALCSVRVCDQVLGHLDAEFPSCAGLPVWILGRILSPQGRTIPGLSWAKANRQESVSWLQDLTELFHTELISTQLVFFGFITATFPACTPVISQQKGTLLIHYYFTKNRRLNCTKGRVKCLPLCWKSEPFFLIILITVQVYNINKSFLGGQEHGRLTDISCGLTSLQIVVLQVADNCMKY